MIEAETKLGTETILMEIRGDSPLETDLSTGQDTTQLMAPETD